jgi:Tol biopolymer transport system component
MKKKSVNKVLLIIFLGVCLSFVGISQQTEDPGVLLRSAIEKEEVDGDLQGAIELYQHIIEKFSANHTVAARSQLRIGLCYEKLGQKTVKLAQDAFQKVIDNYPQQSDEVKIAKEKLSLLLKTQSTVKKKSEEFNIQKVWDDAIDYWFMGSPSPDGRYVTFVDRQNFENLGIRDLNKKENRLLTNIDSWAVERGSWSIFSPDGNQIAYNWQNKEKAGELRTIGVEGGTPRTLCKDMGFPAPMSWSKDGSRILVSLRQKKSVDIAFVSVKDGSVKKLRSFPSENFSIQKGMSLSADGQFIAFSMKQPAESSDLDIYILSADGNYLAPLISHPADDVVLGWTPDGKSILFKSDRSGSTDLWAVQVVAGKPEGDPVLVRPALGNIIPFGLTPDGSLYYGLYSGWSDIFVAELDPETGKVLSPPVKAVEMYEGSNSAPDWTSDGQFLVCRSSRGNNSVQGESSLLIRNSQTESIRELIPETTSSLNFHYIRWSPDGRSILGIGDDEKGNYGALWDIDAQTGESEIIARSDEKGFIFQPEWAPDGESLFFLRRNGGQRIIHHDRETGEEKILFDSPAHTLHLTLSPAGRLLAFYADDTVMLLSTSGGEPRKLIQEKDIRTIIWSRDGRYLLYGKRQDAQSKMIDVWRIPVEGGESQKLELSMTLLMHMRAHPDGRHIAFTASVRPEKRELWVMKNFLPKTKDKK